MARIKCDRCDETFNRPSSLKRHNKTLHSEVTEAFKCKQCLKLFVRPDLLLRHERQHRGEGFDACWICSRRLRSDYLPKHIASCQRRAEKLLGQSTRILEEHHSLSAAPAPRTEKKVEWKNISFIPSPAEDDTPERTVDVASEALPRDPSPRWVVSDALSTYSGGKIFTGARLVRAIMDDDVKLYQESARQLQGEGLTSQKIDALCSKFETTGGLPRIMLASWNDRRNILRHLIDGGTDVNQRGLNNWTTLHCASLNGSIECIKLLLEAGADVDAQLDCEVDDSQRKVTPLWLAVQGEHIEAAMVLLSWGADANGGSEPRGPSPLQCACRNDDFELAEYLISNGADIVGKPGSLEPLDEASRHGGHLRNLILRHQSRLISPTPISTGPISAITLTINPETNPYVQEIKRHFPEY